MEEEEVPILEVPIELLVVEGAEALKPEPVFEVIRV